MPTDIVIKVGDLELTGILEDTVTAMTIANALPIEAPMSVWGDEFYFETPLDLGPDETATSMVRVGDIGYWPAGRAIAIFFGPTPMSTPGGPPVPASDVNLIGRIDADAEKLKSAENANTIRIEQAPLGRG